jgi:eukaryotic-like serine/threonine-protein kinase
MSPQPTAVCPNCRHSNSSTALECEHCRQPMGSSEHDGTRVHAEGWSLPVSAPQSMLGQMPTLASGQILGGRYEILKELGQGGMGAVYKARDRELDRIVAVKVIRPELAGQPLVLQRFKQELILARQITHRNVIRIFDMSTADGIKYITMEFIEGKDLCGRLEERRFTVEESVRIMRQVCAALDAAHSEDVIHRDLKPQNIMIGERGKVTVMDFGLARSMEMNGLTQTGAMLGTPAYMSPEQAKGQQLDARSDLFAFGIIFYELLTGKVPFHADSVLASLLKRTQEAPPPPSQLDPSIPEALSNLTQKCLAIDLSLRYQSAAEVLADLDLIIAGRGEFSTASILTTMPGNSMAGVTMPGFYVPGATMPVFSQPGALQGTPSIAAPEAVAPPARRLSRVTILAGLAAVIVLIAVVAFVYRAKFAAPPVAHNKPTTVLVADFTNLTGDPIFDGTLEPMFNVALEGASFISAFNRGAARELAGKLPHPTDKLDEQSGRLVALSQGVNTVIAGSLRQRDAGYKLSVEAVDAVTGKTIGSADISAPTKDALLLAVPGVAVPIRRALGDTTPKSVQLAAASGTFTAASLEVVHQYGIAMEQQFSGKWEDALQSFSKAAALDPNFGRAYSGMAAASRALGRGQDAQKYFKLAMEHVDRMTERERYRTRGLYYATIGDLPKCVEEYQTLVNQFPSDNVGHNNLASCYADLRNMPKALEEARHAVEVSPTAMQRMNLSLYADYAGDFDAADREARKVLELNPGYPKGYLVLAYAQLGRGQVQQALQSFQKMEKVSPVGASIASLGLGDLAIYEGRFSNAARILETGAAADLAAKNPRAYEKFAALAFTQLAWGHRQPAIEAAEQALAGTKKVNIRFLAARILAEAGEPARVRTLAAGLAAESTLEPQVDAKLLEGELALKEKDTQRAIRIFTEANTQLDTWIGRFDLGRAYLAAQLYTEADSEFDRCIKRRGEALELNDGPTYGYFPAVFYYQGAVREGLKSPGAADSFRQYLAIRGKAGEDPLLADIQRRIPR